MPGQQKYQAARNSRTVDVAERPNRNDHGFSRAGRPPAADVRTPIQKVRPARVPGPLRGTAEWGTSAAGSPSRLFRVPVSTGRAGGTRRFRNTRRRPPGTVGPRSTRPGRTRPGNARPGPRKRPGPSAATKLKESSGEENGERRHAGATAPGRQPDRDSRYGRSLPERLQLPGVLAEHRRRDGLHTGRPGEPVEPRRLLRPRSDRPGHDLLAPRRLHSRRRLRPVGVRHPAEPARGHQRHADTEPDRGP